MKRWLLAALPFAIAVAAPITSRPQPSTTDVGTCSVTLAGWEHGEIIPSYLVWESVFRDVALPESSSFLKVAVDGRVRDRIRSNASATLSRVAAIRGGPPSAFDADRESVAADAILSSRDQLIRGSDETTLELLRQLADSASRQRTYSLPARGLRRSVDGTSKCELVVKGREYPHLIPEFENWEWHLRLYSDAAALAAGGAVDYPAEHLLAIQQVRLPLPTRELRRFVDFARDVTAAVENARRNGSSESDVASLIMTRRAALLRSSAETVWLKILKDVAKTREGIVFTFPSGT
jgi:hypothetical protein